MEIKASKLYLVLDTQWPYDLKDHKQAEKDIPVPLPEGAVRWGLAVSCWQPLLALLNGMETPPARQTFTLLWKKSAMFEQFQDLDGESL